MYIIYSFKHHYNITYNLKKKIVNYNKIIIVLNSKYICRINLTNILNKQ